MKRALLLVSLVVSSLIFNGCDKKSSSTDDTVASVITQGTWKVHFYSVNGKEETSTYSGLTFTFASSGAVTVTNGATTNSGTWSEITDSGKKKLVLTWTGGAIPVLLLEIEEDWIIDAKTATMIELSNTGGSAKVLHFQKK